MAQPESVQVLVLGSGFGGKLLAWHMARSGRRTAVVERRWIGGSCPNIACLPSKNEIWSARIAHLAQHASEFGTVTGPAATDMAKVRQRKRDMVDAEIALHLRNYQTSGAELIMGTGHFVAPKTLEVRLNDGGTRMLVGEQVFLNLGTQAAIPNVPGLEAARPLTHIDALELDYLPSHLIVLGGGYVGLELAQAYYRFGSRVTVIERGPQLMSREDPDVAAEVQRILNDEGIQILVGAETLDVHGRSGEEVRLRVRASSGEQQIASIGIGGHLAMPPLPHHRASGSVPRRFDRVKLEQEHRVGEDRGRRNTGCAGPVGPPDVRTCARTRSASRRQPPRETSARRGAAVP
jgi:pyruvate/2-oxoglutarate dehydrogenase complex dihydrolipoamide dehydrogenase (E3) component